MTSQVNLDSRKYFFSNMEKKKKKIARHHDHMIAFEYRSKEKYVNPNVQIYSDEYIATKWLKFLNDDI